MKKQPSRRPLSTILLILGMVFLAIGLVADQTVFTWVSIFLVLASLITGGRWLRPRK